MNQAYVTLTCLSVLHKVLQNVGVQWYKNNAWGLLSHMLNIVNSDWLQHARSVRGVYEFNIFAEVFVSLFFVLQLLDITEQPIGGGTREAKRRKKQAGEYQKLLSPKGIGELPG